MQFFQGQQEAQVDNWDSMAWHQKAQHIIDHVADQVMTYYYLWIPAVASSMFASLLLFSPEGPVPEIMNMFLSHGTPLVQPSVFGRKMPSFDGEGGSDGVEGDDMGMDD